MSDATKLRDEDIETTFHAGSTEPRNQDTDDADVTDADGQDGDATDESDGDAADTADGDDADGTDA